MVKTITIKISDKDLIAMEDIFFCGVTEEEYEVMRPQLLKIWKRIIAAVEN